MIWHLIAHRLFSAELCQIGLVRLIDLYDGREADGSGRWLTWDALLADEWYLEGEPSTAWTRVAAPAFEAMSHAVQASAEATAWMRWFSPLQDDDGRPGEAPGEATRPCFKRAR